MVGDRIELVGEGRSTATLELVGGQVALLDALVATGTPVVVVVVASKPLVLPPSAHAAAAVVWAANPGMRGGQAVAELVLGLIEPEGRLPISFARHAGQQPTYYNVVRGQHGVRYADLTQSPAFAFGEGLSYTTVEYDGLRVLGTEHGPDDVVRAEVTLTNTGPRPVRETVQVYVSDTVTSVTWAEKELKAYRKVDLAPGESTTVGLEVPVADCTLVDARGRRVVEPGEFELRVGPSSREDALLRATFTVTGSPEGCRHTPRAPEGARSTRRPPARVVAVRQAPVATRSRSTADSSRSTRAARSRDMITAPNAMAAATTAIPMRRTWFASSGTLMSTTAGAMSTDTRFITLMSGLIADRRCP